MSTNRELEQRLRNTEGALIGLWALIEEGMPRDSRIKVDKMLESYFNANDKLGGFKGEPTSFPDHVVEESDTTETVQ